MEKDDENIFAQKIWKWAILRLSIVGDLATEAHEL